MAWAAPAIIAPLPDVGQRCAGVPGRDHPGVTTVNLALLVHGARAHRKKKRRRERRERERERERKREGERKRSQKLVSFWALKCRQLNQWCSTPSDHGTGDRGWTRDPAPE